MGVLLAGTTLGAVAAAETDGLAARPGEMHPVRPVRHLVRAHPLRGEVRARLRALRGIASCASVSSCRSRPRWIPARKTSSAPPAPSNAAMSKIRITSMSSTSRSASVAPAAVKGCQEFGNGSLFLQIRHDRCQHCNQCAIALACPAQAFVRVPTDQPYLLKSQEGGRLMRRWLWLLPVWPLLIRGEERFPPAGVQQYLSDAGDGGAPHRARSGWPTWMLPCCWWRCCWHLTWYTPGAHEPASLR